MFSVSLSLKTLGNMRATGSRPKKLRQVIDKNWVDALQFFE